MEAAAETNPATTETAADLALVGRAPEGVHHRQPTPQAKACPLEPESYSSLAAWRSGAAVSSSREETAPSLLERSGAAVSSGEEEQLNGRKRSHQETSIDRTSLYLVWATLSSSEGGLGRLFDGCLDQLSDDVGERLTLRRFLRLQKWQYLAHQLVVTKQLEGLYVGVGVQQQYWKEALEEARNQQSNRVDERPDGSHSEEATSSSVLQQGAGH